MRKFVAFIPEIIFSNTLKNKKKLSKSLYILPTNHEYSKNLREEIKSRGYTVNGGAYLYFEGDLEKDVTSYEIFHGYCLALTFFYVDGRASCRAIKELDIDKNLDLYIDKFDKFGVDPDDLIYLNDSTKKKIDTYYHRILPHLEIKQFNSFRNSLEFFSLFLKENEIRIRLLYLSICLESLFLESDTEGISHKLGIRTATFLYYFNKNIDKYLTFKEVRNGYALRSTIIHGGDYQKESSRIIKGGSGSATTELDHVLILEKIVKNVFHFILLDKDYYAVAQNKNLGQKIDQEIIL